MLCRHCQASIVSRPRGLCWSCFYTPEVRDLYPISSKFARRGLGIGNSTVVLPPYPTQAQPGSQEKIAILQQRAFSRHELFHPEDAPRGSALVSSRAG